MAPSAPMTGGGGIFIRPSSSAEVLAYQESMRNIITAAATTGHVVIVGRGGQVLLANRRNVLHVRVIAPLELRVAYTARREGLDTFTPQPTSFRTARNVTLPALTAVLPHPSRATGTAVIICPGGGFHSLAIDHEGIEVARWLNTRGVAAFVLKYRLLATEVRDEDFERQIQANLSDRNKLREVMASACGNKVCQPITGL